MVGANHRTSYPYVVIDLNTQIDFCSDQGACKVSNLEALLPSLQRIIGWARTFDVPVVSSVDSHRPCEVPPRSGRKHCVDGTIGQEKLEFTKLTRRKPIQVDNTLSVPLDLFHSYQQVIFRQRGEDLLANPKADRFLTQLHTQEYLVLGNAVEEAIRSVTLGLLARERRLTVIRDACGFFDSVAADLSFRLFAAKGVRVLTVDELLQEASSIIRSQRNPDGCASRNGNGRHDPRSDGNEGVDPVLDCPRVRGAQLKRQDALSDKHTDDRMPGRPKR